MHKNRKLISAIMAGLTLFSIAPVMAAEMEEPVAEEPVAVETQDNVEVQLTYSPPAKLVGGSCCSCNSLTRTHTAPYGTEMRYNCCYRQEQSAGSVPLCGLCLPGWMLQPVYIIDLY